VSKQYFIDREKGGERVVLVQMHVYRGEHHDHFDEALAEFEALALSAGADIVGIVIGKLTDPNPKYFIGTGKADEIAEVVKKYHADLVLFNHELSPAQARNCEALFECRVHDRSELILDIFSQRARTFEGQLQVELAQLQHMSTRLVHGWTHLERQKGGIGLRGPGETQLETDRRLIANRIKVIKKRLEKVQTQREQNRRKRLRSEMPLIAIVGYTNAGKSTLFNALTSSNIYVANQLFSTLDTTMHRITLPKIGKTIMVDTVGFIQQLPHELIAAFKATLEETRQADLLLHVIDASTENSVDRIAAVNHVLNEIGASDVPQLQVMNKIDLSPQLQPRIDYSEKKLPKRVWVSSQENTGLDLLRDAIVSLLSQRMVSCLLTLQPTQGRLRAKLYELGVVKNETIKDDCWVMKLEIQQADFERLCQE